MLMTERPRPVAASPSVKQAVVTGGASGIGAAVARRFTRDGMSVAILDRDKQGACKTAKSLPGARVYHCDVGSSASVDAAFERMVSELGRIDVVAHVAGVSPSMAHWDYISEINTRRATEAAEGVHPLTPLEVTINTSDEEWTRTVQANLGGTFFVVRAALRAMRGQPAGVIITTASNSAVTGWPGIAHYAASKGGVLSFTRSVAREVIDAGIRVNCVAPGGVDTPMMRNKPPSFNPGPVSVPPIGRVASPDEIAAVYSFLASDAASYLVGETLNANGGVHTV